MERAWPRGVYHALQDYTGATAYADVLGPWLAAHGTSLSEQIAPLATHGAWWREEYAFGDLLEIAYALSRVSDALLLGFQPPLPDGAAAGYSHQYLEADWPVVSAGEYLQWFTALGMAPIAARVFDPFFHEIVSVDQAPDADAPVEITEEVWPGLMLGEMLFSRAGVRVRAGSAHAVAGIADQSVLHDVFLRRYRPTSDGSEGWGHNSQWKTDFRRDYLTASAYHFNVDAKVGIEADPPQWASEPPALTPPERADLVRHRCLVREPASPAGREATPWWRLTVPRP